MDVGVDGAEEEVEEDGGDAEVDVRKVDKLDNAPAVAAPELPAADELEPAADEVLLDVHVRNSPVRTGLVVLEVDPVDKASEALEALRVTTLAPPSVSLCVVLVEDAGQSILSAALTSTISSLVHAA